VNLFIDTNVIIDLLAKREPFYHESLQLFSLADSKQVELTISALSLINTHYILNDVMKLKDSRPIIGKFKVLVASHTLNDKVIDLALNGFAFKDSDNEAKRISSKEKILEITSCDQVILPSVKLKMVMNNESIKF